MHVLTTGAVLVSVEEIREFRLSEGDRSDVEESGPIVMRDNRGPQLSASHRPKTALFTDPSAACDTFPPLDRAGSTLTDSSNNADELIDAVLKRATRNAQRSVAIRRRENVSFGSCIQRLPAQASGTTCAMAAVIHLYSEWSPVQLPCASAACGAGAVPRIACRRSAERVREGMRARAHTHTHTHNTHTHNEAKN